MVLYSVVAVEHEASYSMNSDVDKGQTLMLISARHVKSHELRPQGDGRQGVTGYHRMGVGDAGTNVVRLQPGVVVQEFLLGSPLA